MDIAAAVRRARAACRLHHVRDLVEDHGDQDHGADDDEGPVRVEAPDAARCRRRRGTAHWNMLMPLSMTRMIAEPMTMPSTVPSPPRSEHAAEHGRRDRVELVGDAHLLRHLADVGGVADAGDAARARPRSRRSSVSTRLHGDARVLRRVAVAADGVDVAAEHREVQHVGRDRRPPPAKISNGYGSSGFAADPEQAAVRELEQRRRRRG